MTQKKPETYKAPRILPPHWLLAGIIGILVLGRLETGTIHILPGGVFLIALALIIVIWCWLFFQRQKTTIIPGKQPTSLIIGGPFRYSRNPIYLAMVVGLAGVWSFTGGFSPFAIIIGFITIIQKRYIAMEEQHMLAEFGEEYLKYCLAVRRWI